MESGAPEILRARPIVETSATPGTVSSS